MVPKQSSETEMPVRPRSLVFIGAFHHTIRRSSASTSAAAGLLFQADAQALHF
jgi:hypothetical protein